jgi:hypothetical protein
MRPGFAQQRIQPADLLQYRFKCLRLPQVISAGKRIFGFQPHSRNRVADFMGEAGSKPPHGGQALGCGGALALTRKRLARVVQCVYQTIEFLLARPGQGRKVGRAALVVLAEDSSSGAILRDHEKSSRASQTAEPKIVRTRTASPVSS